MDNGNLPIFSISEKPATTGILAGYKNQPLVGLTKREYFAAMAMCGHLSCPHVHTVVEADYDEVAEWSVAQSDALLKELEK